MYSTVAINEGIEYASTVYRIIFRLRVTNTKRFNVV